MDTHNNYPGAFSPDGRRFAAGSTTGVVKVWDVATGATALQLGPLRDASIRFVNFSSDGTRIVTANLWGEVRLWDAATGQPASAILYHGANIGQADFSQDGKLLLTSSAVGIVHVWHAHDGSPVGTSFSHETGVRSAQFDAETTRVASSGGTTVCVSDVQTGQLLAEPMQHSFRLFNATFSPDGHFVRSETVNSPSNFTSFWLWSVPPPLPAGTTAPDWLLELATLCATKIINDAGQCVEAPDAVEKIDDVRRSLAALPPDAPYAAWGRWVLDDRPDRPIAPGFTITSAEAAELETRLATPHP